MLLVLAPLLAVLLCAFLARRSQGTDIAAIERLAGGAYVPLALGAVNALLVWWVFGFERTPVLEIHDEAAYLLQAQLFARGRWTGAAPPLPEFFAQMHVITSPVLASKYPPGTSLFLTPFVLIGFPALGPMLLAAITGALIFVLSSRLSTAGTRPRAESLTVALLTWVIWTTAPTALRWQATFLSQTLTVALWLFSLYLVLKYREERRTWALVALAGAVGLCAITRPVTAVALVLPVGVVMMREIYRARALKPLLMAVLTGTCIVAILPLHNRMTTGDWRLTPLVKYSREYLPSDFPGFGLDSTRQVAPLPPDLEQIRREFFDIRRQHTTAALPETLAHRTLRSMTIVVSGWRFGLIVFVLIGAIVMPAAGRFGFGMSLGLLLAYSIHSHRPQWSQYYFEAAPAYAFAVAAGIWGVARWVIGGAAVLQRRVLWSVAEPRAAVATLVTAIALAIPGAVGTPTIVAARHADLLYHRRFAEALAVVSRQSPKAILFVDYGQTHNPYWSLVRNVPDLANAGTWVAYDRGVDDLRLMRLAPDRRGYIYHADKGLLTRLPPLAELERVVAAR
jgi:hypothetical protein